MSSYEKQEPKSYVVQGSDLKCPVCGNGYFRKRNALLNTPVMTFFNLDWANRNATCFVCSNCTHIIWFLG